MATICGSPFEWLEFDKIGKLRSPSAIDRINKALVEVKGRELLIVSHGWNNDRDDAWKLYWTLWSSTADALMRLGLKPGKFVVVGLLWPAMKWRDSFDLDQQGAFEASGMALSAQGGAAAADTDLDEQLLRQAADDFVDLVDTENGSLARDMAIKFIDSEAPKDAEAFLQAARDAVDTENSDLEEAAEFNALKGTASQVLADLAAPLDLNVEADVGTAQGLGDVLRSVISGPRAAAGRLFNYLTYYTMKKRAGVVGRALAAELPKFRAEGSLRIHLVGHSFGARLVTAAAHDSNVLEPAQSLQSLTLLQGAFSHNAFAGDADGGPKGAFESAHRKIHGPVVITHTHNDKAVTIAYAIASRLARDNSKAIGDKNDEFGAIGANGALRITEDYAPPPLIMQPDRDYQLVEGKVHNYLADACVSSHSDVGNANVGRLLAAAIT